MNGPAARLVATLMLIAAFETRDLLRETWATAREALRPRVEEADARYRAILHQASDSDRSVKHH
jgi:hypothetical protein